MAVRPILIYGNPLLHKKAEPVEEITDDIRELIDDMYETMFAGKGIGLAAIQVSINKAVIVIDLKEQEKNVTLLTIINPEIIDIRGSSAFEEGCLSIPDVTAEVIRAEEITIRYMTKDGEVVEEDFSGLPARVIQHEYDHLQGILFPQRLEPNERKKISPQLRKLAKGIEV